MLFRSKAAISHLLHEYLSGYCTIRAVYLVKSWYNSWTVHFPCLIVSNLLDACLCVNVFRKHFCNPSITVSSDQSLIRQSCLLTFLVYHSSALPLSLIPKYSTWKSVLSLSRRLFSLSHRSIPAINVSYTLRSGLPEYSSGNGMLNFVLIMIESSDIISQFSANIIFTIQCIGSLGQWPFVDATDEVFVFICWSLSGGFGVRLVPMLYASVCPAGADVLSVIEFSLFITFA